MQFHTGDPFAFSCNKPLSAAGQGQSLRPPQLATGWHDFLDGNSVRLQKLGGFRTCASPLAVVIPIDLCRHSCLPLRRLFETQMLAMHRKEIPVTQGRDQIINRVNRPVKQREIGIEAGNLVRIATTNAAQTMLLGILDG